MKFIKHFTMIIMINKIRKNVISDSNYNVRGFW